MWKALMAFWYSSCTVIVALTVPSGWVCETIVMYFI